METTWEHEVALQLAREVRDLGETAPHLHAMPRFDWTVALALFYLERAGEASDREPEGVALDPLTRTEFARYHRGTTPQTGRARRRRER